jgi:hypothetical protein
VKVAHVKAPELYRSLPSNESLCRIPNGVFPSRGGKHFRISEEKHSTLTGAKGERRSLIEVEHKSVLFSVFLGITLKDELKQQMWCKNSVEPSGLMYRYLFRISIGLLAILIDACVSVVILSLKANPWIVPSNIHVPSSSIILGYVISAVEAV